MLTYLKRKWGVVKAIWRAGWLYNSLKGINTVNHVIIFLFGGDSYFRSCGFVGAEV
jgi:hypothetical protein